MAIDLDDQLRAMKALARQAGHHPVDDPAPVAENLDPHLQCPAQSMLYLRQWLGRDPIGEWFKMEPMQRLALIESSQARQEWWNQLILEAMANEKTARRIDYAGAAAAVLAELAELEVKRAVPSEFCNLCYFSKIGSHGDHIERCSYKSSRILSPAALAAEVVARAEHEEPTLEQFQAGKSYLGPLRARLAFLRDGVRRGAADEIWCTMEIDSSWFINKPSRIFGHGEIEPRGLMDFSGENPVEETPDARSFRRHL